MAQLLFKCARLFNEQAITLVRERSGLSIIRTAHTQLFPHIDLEGTRLTELARRLGISKQAVGQLVNELEEIGTLERIPDPDDRRAKRIRFSRVGQQGLLEGLGILREMEAEIAHEIGEKQLRTLHKTLLALLNTLEERVPTSSTPLG